MTLLAFLQLDYDGRLDAANNAVCIGGRAEGKFMVLLYQLDAFYVEVYYHKSLRRIVSLFGFDDMSLLDIYLENMKVEISLNDIHKK